MVRNTVPPHSFEESSSLSPRSFTRGHQPAHSPPTSSVSQFRVPLLSFPGAASCAVAITAQSLFYASGITTSASAAAAPLPTHASQPHHLNMSSSAGKTVLFPPRKLIDYVIHFDSSDFHVHKFVLHHHSTYFRTHFETLLQASQDSSSSSSNAPQQPCSHPSIAHCIHLPLQTRLVEGGLVTAADLRLFLCHLYFSAHYCYPPFLPLTDVDLDDDFPPLSLHFTPVPTLDWSGASRQLRSTSTDDGAQFSRTEALLTLAYSTALRRCRSVRRCF